MEEQTDIKLGFRVRDRISGYEGIVTDIGTHITGCTRYGVMPDNHEDTTDRGSTEFFYGAQLEILSTETEFVDAGEQAIQSTSFELGNMVRDDITGFKGIATSITYNLYNCPRVAISLRRPDNNRGLLDRGESNLDDVSREWFDAPRVYAENKGIMPDYAELMQNEVTAETGAPSSDVGRKADKK